MWTALMMAREPSGSLKRVPVAGGAGESVATATAGLLAQGFAGGEAGGLEQPGSEHGSRAERGGLAAQHDEHRLGDIAGQLGLAHLPERGAVDHVDVALHEPPESGFRARAGEFRQPVLFLRRVHFTQLLPAARKGDQLNRSLNRRWTQMDADDGGFGGDFRFYRGSQAG
jgi:hypothetical protein